jgi:hypothetical protein
MDKESCIVCFLDASVASRHIAVELFVSRHIAHEVGENRPVGPARVTPASYFVITKLISAS